MLEEAAPQFVRFVSSVEGRLVSRWDANGSSFGARVATSVERAEGAEAIVWDTACVVPLTAAFCARFDRELRNALKAGDLVERSREDWLTWLRAEEAREDARFAPELPSESPGTDTPPPAEAEPETKPEGRKKKQ
jgi:hypothetical protein